MNIRNLTRNDANSINRWLHKRRQRLVDSEELPKASYIIPGVAACGIRACEGNVGMMDSLVTNPYVSPATRDRALNALFAHVTSQSGFKRIIGFTTDDNTHERAIKHGFKQLHYALLSYSKD